MKNLWILTEERPKNFVIQKIIERFAFDKKFKLKISKVQILPIMLNNKFSFVYKAVGIECQNVDSIYIKIISGNSSFVDHLVFYEEKLPTDKSIPLYAIEETKTDDSESRNTGVYQRCSKFVFIDFYYPKVKKIMFYNLQIQQKEKPTDTYIFGTKMLLTLDVEIWGKKLDGKIFRPFKNIDELISQKNKMSKPHYGIPVNLEKQSNKIFITAKLEKDKKLTHDPNIGMTTIMSSCLRKLDWHGDIIIKDHKLPNQNSVGNRNKFVLIANQLNIKLDKLKIPKANLNDRYWKYDCDQEKIATIFLHNIIENYTNAKVIYENHGGCERGYFLTKESKPIAIEKYQEGKRDAYKKGDKNAIIHIPDIIIYNPTDNQIINGEGKTFANKEQGIKELANYDYIENEIIKPLYKPKKIIRTVIIFGSKKIKIKESKIGFLLNNNGEIVTHKNTPPIIREAVLSLLK